MEIQADSLEEVSKFSADEAYRKIGRPLLVDDSGMFIAALNGFPGVYSASTLSTIGNKGILKLMEGVKNRKAYFKCCVSFHDGKRIRPFTGIVRGTLLHEERGAKGFGYDPIMSPEGYSGKSMAEVSMAEKNLISHRGKAFDKFFKWYSDEAKGRRK